MYILIHSYTYVVHLSSQALLPLREEEGKILRKQVPTRLVQFPTQRTSVMKTKPSYFFF